MTPGLHRCGLFGTLRMTGLKDKISSQFQKTAIAFKFLSAEQTVRTLPDAG